MKTITPKEYLAIRREQQKIIDAAEATIEKAFEAAGTCPEPANLRPATADDIVKGAVIWYPHWGPERRWNVVEGIGSYGDEFKAYDYEGARYGLYKAFVEIETPSPDGDGKE